MKLLLIGSGGREHAIARKLSESPRLSALYCAPGNPGTALFGTNIPLTETQIEELVNFAKVQQIDLTIVGPEGPLVNGIVDTFTHNGLAIIGPSASAARLEGSKKWAKGVMKKYHIPTSYYEDFSDLDSALAYVTHKNTFPIVIKADGLAAGKGVTIASDHKEAKEALENCFIHNQFGTAGQSVVIEDFLVGEEASVLAFCDGKTIIPMQSAQDHKTIFDEDKGPNTGGMGTYSPAPVVTDSVMKKVVETILEPLVAAMAAENATFNGIVFAGLMIHNDTPYVVEFNARFGDPETQVVLALLESDLVVIFEAMALGTLDTITLKWKSESAVCVVMASEGYPGSFEKGFPILGIEELPPSAYAVHAGTAIDSQGQLVTNGGRVLGIVGQGETLEKAIHNAYDGVSIVQFKGNYYRHDIGKKGLRR